jgi:hypothetical protein
MPKDNQEIVNDFKAKLWRLGLTSKDIDIYVDAFLTTYGNARELEGVEKITKEILNWNQLRINEWHKTCLTNDFNNGRFWEAKDTQVHVMGLVAEHMSFYSKSVATYDTEAKVKSEIK